MPRVYSTTDKRVGVGRDQTTIHIRQVLGYGNENVVRNLLDVIGVSQKMVSFALKLPDLHKNELFLWYFCPDAFATIYARDIAAKVKDVLTKVQNGITADHGVKVADLGTSEGYVATYRGGAQGEIHINRRHLLVGDDQSFGMSVITYIHEASHRFAQTKDHGPRGYINGEGNYKATGLTGQEAWNNADSYGWFVWKVAQKQQDSQNKFKGYSLFLGNFEKKASGSPPVSV
jgi:hypothetical protein